MSRRAAFALIGAAAGVLLLFMTWYAAFHVGVFERADQKILNGFAGLQRPRLSPVASFIAHLCDPGRYVYLAAVPVLLAVARRRVRPALAIGAILLGANVTTQFLKPLLAHPRPPTGLSGAVAIASGSWPSGHATAAMSLALCCVIAAPARLRPLVAALGAIFAVAVSYSFLTLGWHYPSDVFGGFLVAGTWTMLGVAAVFATGAGGRQATVEIPRRLSVGEALGPMVVALLGALALAGLVVIARPRAVVDYARGHTTFIVGAAAIAALGLLLATGIMLAVAGIDLRTRRRFSRPRGAADARGARDAPRAGDDIEDGELHERRPDRPDRERHHA